MAGVSESTLTLVPVLFDEIVGFPRMVRIFENYTRRSFVTRCDENP